MFTALHAISALYVVIWCQVSHTVITSEHLVSIYSFCSAIYRLHIVVVVVYCTTITSTTTTTTRKDGSIKVFGIVYIIKIYCEANILFTARCSVMADLYIYIYIKRHYCR